MPQSSLSAFNGWNDFQAALRDGGCVDLVLAGPGKFWVRLSQIDLYRMSLAAAEERQSRVAFVSIPPRLVRVTLPTQPAGSLTCDGIPVQADEIVMHPAGYGFYERTNGPCRWGTMLFLAQDLVASVRTMNEATLALSPGGLRWKPPAHSLRTLVGLHRDAIRATDGNPGLPVANQAAHGLEQQLLGALTECLVGEPIDQGSPSLRQHAEIMIRFQDMIGASPFEAPSIHAISAGLGISAATLRTCCHEHLGMGPSRYLYLRRMHLANRALRVADSSEASVAQLVRLHGFKSRVRFQAAYREIFGELPSATLQRQAK